MDNNDSFLELLLICECSDQLWPISFYNPLTGVAVWSYKGAELSQDEPRDCVLVADEYLLVPAVKKPLVVVVGLESKNRTVQRSFPSAPLQSIAVSADGSILCASTDKNLCTWMLSSGKFCSMTSGHLQAVTKIAFTDDSSKVVSAGKDGAILVWNLEDLICPKNSKLPHENVEPWRKWKDHSLSITDLKVGSGGAASRVYSVSLDQTAQVHDMISNNLLITLRFDCPLTSCAVDNAENRLYIGSSKGEIMSISLSEEPVLRERHVDFVLASSESPVFKGHKQAVIYLSVNIDGTFLASASEDNEVKVWHSYSRQCIRTISCKGPPKRAEFVPKLGSIFDADYSPITQVQTLSKIINENTDRDVVVCLKKNKGETDNQYRTLVSRLMDGLLEEEKDNTFKRQQCGSNAKENLYEVDYLRKELARAKMINKQLYDLYVDEVVKI